MPQKFTLGTYYISIVVTNKQRVLRQAQKYLDKILTCAGLDRQKVNNLHITIVPPFHADYVDASQMSVRCRNAKDIGATS